MGPQSKQVDQRPSSRRSSNKSSTRTKGMLQWQTDKSQNKQQKQAKSAAFTHEKFWADDRVPFVNSPIHYNQKRHHLDETEPQIERIPKQNRRFLDDTPIEHKAMPFVHQEHL